MTLFSRLVRRLTAAFLPERCAFCGRVVSPLEAVCDDCHDGLPIISPPICRLCGHQKKACVCHGKRHHYDAVTAPFYYKEAVRKGVLRLKWRNDVLMVDTFATYMTHAVMREYGKETIDAVCFVPMTKRRLNEHEYNQSELLARAVGERLNVPVLSALSKLYDTTMQKQMRFRIQRTGNVLGVFDVTDESVRGKTILVVDDVLTSGSTLNECAKMLKLYGANRVLAVTLAIRKQQVKTDESE